MSPEMGVIGVGKVGGALARLLTARGYRVTAVYSRDAGRGKALAADVGARRVDAPAEVVAQAELTLLTVPDDAIAGIVGGLVGAGAAAGGAEQARGVIHTSGAHSLDVLAALAARGLMTGSLHPSFPFSAAGSADGGLSGVGFALEADSDRLRGWLHEMVAALGGRALVIPPGGKALYHAALVIASNYTVTLYAVAQRILAQIGADEATAAAALNPLLAATAENIARLGIPDALPGPLVRGDAGTIVAHLRALDELDPAAAALYRALAEVTLPLAEARGVDAAALRRILE
jgi:predicted short-subunit dehydrogenase-like oxidoreductase (DUF2520 family)